jgi:arylsulfatase
MAKKPNILFILPDQQRPDSLGCYGSEAAVTPTLDWLSQTGVTFDNCYVQNPLCCPSRYSVSTGRYPHSLGVQANWYPLRQEERSFGHQMGRAGYNTAAIGKMHYTPWYDNFGFDGRIIAEAKFHAECPDDYARFLQKNGFDRRELYQTQSPEYIRRLSSLTSILPQELHIDSFVGRSVCEYLRNVDGPFFAFASFLSPHNPYDPPQPYDELFADAPMPARNMGKNEVNEKPREAYDYINKQLKWGFKSDEITEEQRLDMWRSYYGLNTLIDDWIKQIIDTLKERGLYDDTIIIYSSDHGDLLGDHGLYYKQCFYEQSVKVPLIIHAPKYFKPQRVADKVELMDTYSTICDLGGADEGPGSQATSLRPILEQKENSSREAVFSENYFGRMVRWEEWKMVYYPGKPYGEIYNLNEDPDEQTNLWTRMEGSTEKQRMKDILLEWAFASEDPLPLPVRPDHQDPTPQRFLMVDGGTQEAAVQPWHLPDMADFYQSLSFSTQGKLR